MEAAEAALREDSGDEGVAAVELKAAIVAQLPKKWLFLNLSFNLMEFGRRVTDAGFLSPVRNTFSVECFFCKFT